MALSSAPLKGASCRVFFSRAAPDSPLTIHHSHRRSRTTMFGPLKANPNPRLQQWNGRTRSSRHDEPMLRRLTQKPVLARLAIVWTTTLLVTLLGVAWGPPFPYRVGEVYGYDLRARVDFEVVNEVELVNQQPGEHGAQRPPVFEK